MAGCAGRGERAAPGSLHEESWHGARSGASPLPAQAQVVAKKKKKKIPRLQVCVHMAVDAE